MSPAQTMTPLCWRLLWAGMVLALVTGSPVPDAPSKKESTPAAQAEPSKDNNAYDDNNNNQPPLSPLTPPLIPPAQTSLPTMKPEDISAQIDSIPGLRELLQHQQQRQLFQSGPPGATQARSKPVDRAFVKQVLRQFFTELKRHPALVAEILQSQWSSSGWPDDAYDGYSPLEEEYIVTVPKWQEMPAFIPGSPQQQPQQQQQQQLSSGAAVQTALPAKENDEKRQDKPTVVKVPVPAGSTNLVKQQQQQQQQQPLAVPFPPNAAVPPALPKGLAPPKLAPSGPGPSFAYPGQAVNNEMYDLDSPGYFYYLYYDDDKPISPADATEVQTDDAAIAAATGDTSGPSVSSAQATGGLHVSDKGGVSAAGQEKPKATDIAGNSDGGAKGQPDEMALNKLRSD